MSAQPLTNDELPARIVDGWDEVPPLWAQQLTRLQIENAEALARIENQMADVCLLAARIKQEVTPFLDGLAKSPLIKMLGVKK